MFEGSLEVKLPTVRTDVKAEVGRVREQKSRREKIREEKVWEERREDQRRERVRRKKMQVREKVRKSRNIVFFPLICGSGGSKSRLAKGAGAEPAGQMGDEKLHAVVARSAFPSQNVQSTVEMLKKCAPSQESQPAKLRKCPNTTRYTAWVPRRAKSLHQIAFQFLDQWSVSDLMHSAFESPQMPRIPLPHGFLEHRWQRSGFSDYSSISSMGHRSHHRLHNNISKFRVSNCRY